ncbi:hypothetical protein LOK49_LG14G01137 [Camellia lanceoleosa]|uniref:Uncharacterized protein n=1 Tax=Camellia lanceoleosa TaxID=1840588 RepID=A0ACC0FA44_9ERIC|nr:hypothetical protein LOK49_LG14G01137 [Camellia lanceoleosa]
MEAALLHSSPDQSISPNKQFTNPKRNNQPLISRSSDNFTPSNFYGGLLHAPRRSLSLLNPQPLLLPLPIPKPNINPLSRGLLCPSKKIKNQKKLKTPVNSDSKPDLKSTECMLIRPSIGRYCYGQPSIGRYCRYDVGCDVNTRISGID